MENQLLHRFEQNEIRSVWYRREWWYSVIDVVKVLTESTDPSAYWRKLKQRLGQEGSEVVTNCHKLKLRARDGKMRQTDCANREVLLRLIQSIPSPKAEPFKLWLAQIGEEKIQETEDPEKALEHLARIYRALGRDEEWIEARLRSVQVRKQLTDEWRKRGVTKGEPFARLTAIISKGIFGLTPAEHRKLKRLTQENLRDHMSNLELIFQMLGEETSRQLTIKENAQGYSENEKTARKGGRLAGESRKRLEKKTGIRVVTSRNFLGDKHSGSTTGELEE